jgi:uncharacterized protein YrrD
MLKLSTATTNLTIFSLRTGHPVGVALRPLINPSNLKIEAWFAQSNFDNGLLLLPTSEIREIGHQGIAVNDKEAITPAEDLVRLEPVIRLDFQLLGRKVYTQSNQFLGKVSDYATDMESFYIQRFYVTPSVFKQLTSDQRVISRLQIIEITDKKIIVKDATLPVATGFFTRPAPVPEG